MRWLAVELHGDSKSGGIVCSASRTAKDEVPIDLFGETLTRLFQVGDAADVVHVDIGGELRLEAMERRFGEVARHQLRLLFFGRVEQGIGALMEFDALKFKFSQAESPSILEIRSVQISICS